MRFTVDPWDPAYGTSLDAELGASSAELDTGVEVPAARWAPVPPVAVPPPAAVLFVDGVRRIDAQVWVTDGDAVAPGLCASYAAGAVRCAADGARIVAVDVRRGVVTAAPAASDVVTWAGTYRVVPAKPDQVLSLALQNDLGLAELGVAVAARGGDGDAGRDDLLVVDGPLRGRQHLPRAIGFVKTHRSGYLPPALDAVVARLAPGERTPVFRLGTSWPRHTWYLRLPGAADAPWAGIVRVECGGELGVDAAVALAHLSQVTLPRHASAAHKDARAPQNLYPIGGLERALRRRLGEPALLYRALRSAAAA